MGSGPSLAPVFPVHPKVKKPPVPDFASSFDAGRSTDSSTDIDQIFDFGEFHFQPPFSSVVILKPQVLFVHVLLPGKKQVMGQSGTSRLLIRSVRLSE